MSSNLERQPDSGSEIERYQVLLEMADLMVHHGSLPELLAEMALRLRRVTDAEFANFSLYDPVKNVMRLHLFDGNELAPAPQEVPVAESPAGWAWQNQQPLVMPDLHSDVRFPEVLNILQDKGLRSYCWLPLTTAQKQLGALGLGSSEVNAYSENDMRLLPRVAALVAVTVENALTRDALKQETDRLQTLLLENARAYREIAQLKDKLATEKLYLEDEIRSELHFEEIVGESVALKRALSQSKTVATSDATVLVLGETGTGKELIARAIHRMSSRKDGSFIKLNCAAIPTGLLESELFGHEKGAFTGAISQKVGRLELADKGTLFLDEVGDIPLELQPKLLRVLQDHEFERLGSIRTIRVNVRLIAATNRELAKSVSQREFRSDLYYRLNVFPIRMPPLRERSQDVALLVRYFVQKFSQRMNKRIETIPTETMRALMGWEWPGNVRELENFIERSVILSEGPVLRSPLAELEPYAQDTETDTTLENLERQYIVRVLRETGGVIAGSGGAAARLGLKRTTLQSRIQRMGISRHEYKS